MSFVGYEYILWSEFPLLLGASTGNLSEIFFEPFSGVHDLDHTYSLVSFQALQPVIAPPDWKLPTVPEIVPLQEKRSGISSPA